MGTAFPQPTTTGGHSSGNDNAATLSPQEKQVIGGVVGSVAGVAIIALLLLVALRYKRRRDGLWFEGPEQLEPWVQMEDLAGREEMEEMEAAAPWLNDQERLE